MDGIQFLSVQGHWGRWAGAVVLSCELYCTGHQTRCVIPTHRDLKYFKNKSQQEIATNHWRNDMLEDRPASTTVSKRQEQQKVLTLCPARLISKHPPTRNLKWREMIPWSLMCEIGVNPECSPNSYPYLPQILSLCQNCRYAAPLG